MRTAAPSPSQLGSLLHRGIYSTDIRSHQRRKRMGGNGGALCAIARPLVWQKDLAVKERRVGRMIAGKVRGVGAITGSGNGIMLSAALVLKDGCRPRGKRTYLLQSCQSSGLIFLLDMSRVLMFFIRRIPFRWLITPQYSICQSCFFPSD